MTMGHGCEKAHRYPAAAFSWHDQMVTKLQGLADALEGEAGEG
jgi:hypothetical protein